MKFRGILSIVVLFEIFTATQMVRASLPDPMAPPRGYQNFFGPRLPNDLWKAPAFSMNSSVSIPDDTSDFRVKGFSERHLDSIFGTDSRMAGAQIKETKPIENIETHNDDTLSDPPVAAVPAPKHDAKRIALIALASVALLAFRKFRRSNAGMPPKPNFL